MIEKILVEVYLPAADCSYDVYVPLKSKLSEVIMLLSGTVTDLSKGYFMANPDTVMCDRKTGVIFNINMTVEELDLHNGSKLMLM